MGSPSGHREQWNASPQLTFGKDLLRSRIYPHAPRTHFWSDSWDPRLYVSLARAGFISIATDDTKLGPVLLPQLEETFAVLDWQNLHRSRNLRRLIASRELAEEQVELRVSDSCSAVLGRLSDFHGRETWLLPQYCELVLELERGGEPGFAIHGIELQPRGATRRLTFGPGEAVLSEWLDRSARVAWVEVDEPWSVEREVIRSVDLPLNLEFNESHPFHARLRATRAAARSRARAQFDS